MSELKSSKPSQKSNVQDHERSLQGESESESPRSPSNKDLAEKVRTILIAQHRGDVLKALDLATELLEDDPEWLELKWHIVLSYARCGLTKRAQDFFDKWDLEETTPIDMAGLAGRLANHRAHSFKESLDDRGKPPIERAASLFMRAYEDVAGLGARVSKDQAWSATLPEDIRQYAGKSAEQYAKVYEDTGGFYSGSSCASMALLSGDPSTAAAMARRVLTRWENAYHEDKIIEEELYLYHMSITQCFLLDAQYKRIDEELLSRIAQSKPKKLAEASSLHRQLNETLNELRGFFEEANDEALSSTSGFDKAVETLDKRPRPRIIHYCGHMMAEKDDNVGRFLAKDEKEVKAKISNALIANHVAAGFGSLACGADIMFAEALLKLGAELHVVLPFAKEAFLHTSVSRGGGNWIKRFNHCLDEATSITYATHTSFMGDDVLFDHGSQVAMGLTIIWANIYGLEPLQIAVWDQQIVAGLAGTEKNESHWKKRFKSDCYIENIPVPKGEVPHASIAGIHRESSRVIKAILFGDMKSFSKLPEERLAIFQQLVMTKIAEVLKKHESKIEDLNTWGDGLFLVLDSVSDAADIALQIQESLKLSREEFAESGLPAEMQFRIGGHLGPIGEGRDPVLDRRGWYGSAIARAARIEPVTAPGEVYVTEQFAAVLSLQSGFDKFRCEYVGKEKSDKSYGRIRMYKLMRGKAAHLK